jgi:uncharacterized protein with PIN domain
MSVTNHVDWYVSKLTIIEQTQVILIRERRSGEKTLLTRAHQESIVVAINPVEDQLEQADVLVLTTFTQVVNSARINLGYNYTYLRLGILLRKFINRWITERHRLMPFHKTPRLQNHGFNTW